MQKFTVPPTPRDVQLTPEHKERLYHSIKQELLRRDAVMVTHYYVADDLQSLTEETGGFIGDSLAMAQFGMRHPASALLVSGVRFMGESAKILSPEKTVIMPTLGAECSLDLGCPAEDFKLFIDQHPDRTVVVYANTSAEVKALADWVVTSSNALDIVNFLHESGHKILWGPDRFLGRYIANQTAADMVMWQGACIVHEEFKAEELRKMIQIYPDAAVLVHPESPASVVELADVVGSTSRLLNATRELPHSQFIVATDKGIFYKMQQLSPNKQFIAAPTAGEGGNCRSCAHCPWMAMNQVDSALSALKGNQNEIHLRSDVIKKARLSLQRMVDFSA